MRFISPEGCRTWARENSVALTEPGWPCLRFAFPAEFYRVTWFAWYLRDVFSGTREVLLWVKEWGIWPSSENWNLYHRLREVQGNRESLQETSGHVFDAKELDDLATFLQVGILFGWDLSVLAVPDHARLFVSHDGYVELASTDEALLARCQSELRSANISMGDGRSA